MFNLSLKVQIILVHLIIMMIVGTWKNSKKYEILLLVFFKSKYKIFKIYLMKKEFQNKNSKILKR